MNDFISNPIEDMQWVKSFCQKCGKCIRKCPTNAILQEPVMIDGHNPTRINYESCAEGFTKYGCGICIKECPFSLGNYEKKEAYQTLIKISGQLCFTISSWFNRKFTHSNLRIFSDIFKLNLIYIRGVIYETL
ncbi:4Fe-4S binding protein [Fusibacter bizertensis]|uniref:4Fe-4S binding protein n=1 Tax=Fusibacter bizertensis TaxID=1488331 RepID=A0ABT6NFY2_9FIRM|nr:4Fe-4S binding protein [Fusibacter bizertensis]MDH8679342.1 4Fe-4S binding protein [Fusibacter bizertensis]